MSSLELDRVSVAYGNIQAVREVSVSVAAGAIVCLLGANGAGTILAPQCSYRLGAASIR